MNLLFLVNPIAGSMTGNRIANALEQSNSIHGIRKQIVFTDAKRLTQQVQSLAVDKDLVIVCGGDGTVSAVSIILSYMDIKPPVAVIPAGTGNDIARATGWFKVWRSAGIDGFWAGMVSGSISPIDVWEFSGHGRFLAYAGVGLDADIVRRVSAARVRYGVNSSSRVILKTFYVMAGLYAICRFACMRKKCRGNVTCRSLDINMPKGRMTFAQLLFAAMPSYSGGCKLSADNREKRLEMMSDGLLETYILRHTGRFMQLLLSRLPGIPATLPPSGRAESATLTLEKHAHLQLDGEWAGKLRAGKIYEVERCRAIPFLIPPDNFTVREKTGLKKEIAELMERLSTPLPESATNRK